VVATEACPSVACTRWIGALLPRLWLACACRSQRADRSEPSPARSSAAFTIRHVVLGSSAPAEARRARCWQPDEPAAPLLAVGREKIRALGEFIHKAGIPAVGLIERDRHNGKPLQVAALHQLPNSTRESGLRARFREPLPARHLLCDARHVVNAGPQDEERLA
jgi:hypothetical protein